MTTPKMQYMERFRDGYYGGSPYGYGGVGSIVAMREGYHPDWYGGYYGLGSGLSRSSVFDSLMYDRDRYGYDGYGRRSYLPASYGNDRDYWGLGTRYGEYSYIWDRNADGSYLGEEALWRSRGYGRRAEPFGNRALPYRRTAGLLMSMADLEKSNKKKLVIMGNLNWDVFLKMRELPDAGEAVDATEDVLEAFNGKGANMALAASRLLKDK